MAKTIIVLLVLLAASLALSQEAMAACPDIAGAKLDHAEVTSAVEVAPGAFREPGANPQHHDYSDLPGFCRVRGFSEPVAGSKIGFEVWLPLARWSGRLHMVGNGAYGSNIYWAQMGDRIRQHDVAIATDTGHSGQDLTFAIGHPERIVDWGQRAVHEAVVAAKSVTVTYYGKPSRFNYFSGCSTGGAQALSEAQRYPADFDGIIAGDPGNNRTSLNMAFLWQFLKNHRFGNNDQAILSVNDLKLVHQAVIGACDTVDGVKDGVISDPRECKFDVASLRCANGRRGDCLSDEQVTALRDMYAGPRDSVTGLPIYPGYPFGSEAVEANPSEKFPGWSAYWDNPAKHDEPQRADFFRYWVFGDPRWDWWSFDWHTDPGVALAKVGLKVDANSPDLSAFRKRGGKLIMFMGWADPVGAAYGAVDYYKSVEDHVANTTHAKNAQEETQKFLRLYMIPGMAHCAGGPGPTNFSTATRDSSPPVTDKSHDMAVAIENWVERREPPQTLIGTHYQDTAKKVVAFQRPLCVFPKVSRYRGGDVNSAGSFRCVTR